MTPAFIRKRMAEQFEKDGIGPAMTDKDQLREDVICAARAWVKDQCRDWRAYAPGSTSRALCAAIHELDAPTPVKPEDLPLGAKFRFAQLFGGETNPVFIMVRVGSDLRAVSTESWGVVGFLPTDRIIPIEGEEG